MSGVSVAEKKAQLEAEGIPWPDCDCHGEPKFWSKDDTRKNGGRWKCTVKDLVSRSRYARSEKGRATYRAKRQRWDNSEKGRVSNRASRARYANSEKGRASSRVREARYVSTHIRSTAGGFSTTYRVPAELKQELVEKLADFRANQRAELSHLAQQLQEESNGRLN